ncbi:MAG: capsular biosynthesis protein [Methylococcales bacterium]|nr:capsular biosynthesis protein [Methylococcales bacterium]
MSQRRSYLLLQGVCSPFFDHLAVGLRAEGHRVCKINFNAGDWLYWHGPACNYRGPLAALPDFLRQLYREQAISDQILFGDRRPVHQTALTAAQVAGIRTHVYEEGYFRPYWVTLEREGVNGHSLLPRDPDWFWETGKNLPDYCDGLPFQSSFTSRAIHDVVFHAACAFNPLFFRHYRTHAPVNAAVEYLGYASRLPFLPFHERRDNRELNRLLAGDAPFFFLPLQLSSDAQVRHHSRFRDMLEVLEHVIASFALHAPERTALLIKNHPLDMGLVNYASMIRQLARRFGLGERVIYMETGDLSPILRRAAGVVTVNSTVGTVALGLNCPTLTLADPIYNLPGLTFQGRLDDFWLNDQKPDAELFRRFRNAVIHATQVNGGFYSRQGIDLAVANSLRRLAQDDP